MRPFRTAAQFRAAANFRTNEKGNIAMMMSISMLAVLAFVGAAIDYTMLSSSKIRSQDLADSLALNAAAYVRTHNAVPTGDDNQGVAPGIYTAAELGFETRGWVVDGSDGLTLDVSYDQAAGEAVVTARGRTLTTFSQIMGYDALPFAAQSRVAFEATEISNVASVVLVLDNSGSMAWDDKPYVVGSGGSLVAPTDTTARITALEDSVESFMDFLSPLVGDQATTGARLFRSGMLAYNTTTISARTRTMAWSLLSDTAITSMTASGGTNSTNSMTTAADWILGEAAIHQNETGRVPLRFAVFMTDGANNNDSATWTDASDTGQWRRVRCRYNNGWSCWYNYRSRQTKPNTYVGYWDGGYRYDYDWVEGDFDHPDDDATLVQCERMKADGVKVFTIGFGLEPGTYDDNAGGTEVITSDTTDQAYSMLAACASDADTFFTAANADELNAAFSSIGEFIINESIRIKA